MKILIVDDDEDLLTIIKLFLTRNGYHVETANTCSDGLNKFYTFQPDLVLLDINVGHEDGRTVCKQIKSRAEYQHTPVVLISANIEALKTYRDYGADEILEKPFEVKPLLQLIQQILSQQNDAALST